VLTIFRFQRVRDKALDHRIHKIVKFDLLKCEGRFLKVLFWVHISQKGNRRAIVESSLGQWKRKYPVYVDLQTCGLRRVASPMCHPICAESARVDLMEEYHNLSP
jgi:hypothetical protein